MYVGGIYTAPDNIAVNYIWVHLNCSIVLGSKAETTDLSNNTNGLHYLAAPLWGPSVEDQQGEDVVSYPHHLGAARQEVQDPVAQGGVEIQGLELNDEFGGYYGVKC